MNRHAPRKDSLAPAGQPAAAITAARIFSLSFSRSSPPSRCISPSSGSSPPPR